MRKHLESKVLAYYNFLRRSGLEDDEVVAAMSKVKLRFSVIAPDASAAAKARMYENVMRILGSIPRLKGTGFEFGLHDIVMRKGDPIRTKVDSVDSLPLF